MHENLLDYGEISEYQGELYENGCLFKNHPLAGYMEKFRVITRNFSI